MRKESIAPEKTRRSVVVPIIRPPGKIVPSRQWAAIDRKGCLSRVPIINQLKIVPRPVQGGRVLGVDPVGFPITSHEHHFKAASLQHHAETALQPHQTSIAPLSLRRARRMTGSSGTDRKKGRRCGSTHGCVRQAPRSAPRASVLGEGGRSLPDHHVATVRPVGQGALERKIQQKRAPGTRTVRRASHVRSLACARTVTG